MNMKINTNVSSVTSKTLINNAQHVGVTRTLDTDKQKNIHENNISDTFTPSDQTRLSKNNGEHTGMASTLNTKEKAKTDEVENRQSELKSEGKVENEETAQVNQQTTQETSSDFEPVIFTGMTPEQAEGVRNECFDGFMGEVGKIKQNSPELSDTIKTYWQAASEIPPESGVDKTEFFTRAVMSDERLVNSNPSLKEKGGRFLNASKAHEDALTIQELNNRGMLQSAIDRGMVVIPGLGDAPGMAAGTGNMGNMGNMGNAGGAGAMGGANPPSGATPPPSMTDMATKNQQLQQDMDNARTIYMQMAADRQKTLMNMWKIMQDMQNSFIETMNEVALNRAKMHDKIMDKWNAALFPEFYGK